MDAILSAIWYPVHALFFTPADDDDDAGVDPIYPLTVFFALGIWFVFKRYQYIRYRAVPFSVPIPEVSFSASTYVVDSDQTISHRLRHCIGHQ